MSFSSVMCPISGLSWSTLPPGGSLVPGTCVDLQTTTGNQGYTASLLLVIIQHMCTVSKVLF